MVAEGPSGGTPSRLVVATRNEHKLRELAEILTGVELVGLPDDYRAPEETGETFAENATIKAQVAFQALGEPAFADDSGIAASGLGGRPGVRSARYAGEHAGDEQNLSKLLRDVSAAGEDRRVEYVCVIALVGLESSPLLFEGRCAGRLTEEPRGSGGFGYDPAFVPDETGADDDRTMAELPAVEKHALSHRGKAVRAMAAYLGL